VGRIAQFGIAVGALGVMLAFMGLFPGVTGIEETGGFGPLQIFTILGGFSLLIFGALIYVKFTFYLGRPATLAQQIGVRLALTGIIFTVMASLADILGFGSNPPGATSDIYLGPWQAVGMVGSLLISSLGVLIYATAGTAETKDDEKE
jgi:hypothetical protein